MREIEEITIETEEDLEMATDSIEIARIILETAKIIEVTMVKAAGVTEEVEKAKEILVLTKAADLSVIHRQTKTRHRVKKNQKAKKYLSEKK